VPGMSPVSTPAKGARPAEATIPKKSSTQEFIEQMLVAVVLALFVRTFVFQTFKIPSASMESTLLVGDQLIVNKMGMGQGMRPSWRPVLPAQAIERGDVLVFKYPVDPERDFIKRVIGLPGETVEVRNKRVLVDGKPLDEPYARFLFPPDADGGESTHQKDPRWYFGPYRVPDGHYFMMGDNRDNSEDSRFWGAMPRDHVKGRALFIHFSYGADVEGGASGLRLSRTFKQIK
jgi:signal peptidase I